MHIIIFEDNSHNNFYPLSLTKPLWELRSGMFSFKERFEIMLRDYFDPEQFYYFTRDQLSAVCQEHNPGSTINDYTVFEKEDFLFINGTVYPGDEILTLEPDSILYHDTIVLAARVHGAFSLSGTILESLLRMNLAKIEKKSGKLQKIEYIWELVHTNAVRIADDFKLLASPQKHNNSVTIIGDETLVYIKDNVRIDPFVVIDVTHGPVVIMENSEIHPFTRIEGPAYIGEQCIILGAKIREGTSIGKYCRIGGEIEESIIHGYSNKYHDGFIGHAYIGEWVNMGAMTTNSDLKNNYKNVDVYIPHEKVATHSAKVGCFMGDFVKTSIGSLINTGASIGPGAMLVHNGSLAPVHVPPFSWFVNSAIAYKDWQDEFIAAAKRMTARRNVEFSAASEKLFKILFHEWTKDVNK